MLHAIDLFCGAGGLSKGFMDAGVDIILGVDNDTAALKTFERNHNGAIGLCADLSVQETFDKIQSIADSMGKTIDLIIGGPPCQGFSTTGPRNFDDPRNKLYLAVFKMVKQYNPKGFLIENVPGMAMLYQGQIKDEILRRFRSMGYNVECKILTAADYGVPQMRKRLVFMGIRSDIGVPVFPEPILDEKHYVTCREAIDDLPARISYLGMEKDVYEKPPRTEYQKKMRKDNMILYNHVATAHKQFVKDVIALVPPGGNWKDLPKGVGESRTFHEAWTRYHGDRPSKTIDTGHRNHFHYEYNRVPTIRENARLQSFPDDFVFLGNKTQQNRQVGNAVPPLLGEALAFQMIKIINVRKNTTQIVKEKLNSIELFAGCGGLLDGFEQSGKYNLLAAVEWESAPCENLVRRLVDKWKMEDASEKVLRFDIQRTEELIHGWHDDSTYGNGQGLDALVDGKSVDVIIGGPPCQAYSIAGRVRDENGMRDDYRNYLFESYLKVVNHYRPKAFLFENVPGILTAKPGNGDRCIIDIIQEEFEKAGYATLFEISDAVIDMTEYGVPQNRSRIIILGLSKEEFGNACGEMLHSFYFEILPKYRVTEKSTVRDAIGDLPALYPLGKTVRYEGKNLAHSLPSPWVANHIARWQSERDMDIFRILTEDIESGRNKYVSTAALKSLYTEKTGKISNVHKYHVLRWDEPSNLIPAHLYKDGLRHIHPDSKQLRSLTVREAARLQTFPDDYVFYGSNVATFRMIGNAVPPLFAKKVASALYELLSK